MISTELVIHMFSLSKGNDNFKSIVRQKSYQVRFDLEDKHGITANAVYDTINIGDESTNYQITIKDYSGTAGKNNFNFFLQKMGKRYIGV